MLQNYLKEPWNVFDFVTVIGSITDILFTEINVRAAGSAGRIKYHCVCLKLRLTLQKDTGSRSRLIRKTNEGGVEVRKQFV